VFNNLGWPELLMLLLFGLMIFGPDQLPKIAGDLGRMIRQLRKLANDASADLRSELGPEFEDVDLASLNPRRFIEKHMLAEDDEDGYDDGPPTPRPRSSDRADVRPAANSVADPAGPVAVESPAEPVADVAPAAYDYNPAPYDYDAT
jgi:sec-independent protein translocase protein TatB